jgi:hypothetical protein
MTLGLAALVLAACVCPAAGQTPADAPMRIGVCDSRGVAIAYARSAEFRQIVAKMHSELQQARAKGDEEQVKKLETEGPWMQVRLHQRSFSTAGAGDLLAKVADGLPGVAREAGVVLIVSKWEMPYRDPAVQIVDVTLPLARLFKPDEATLKILGELTAQEPIPLDELPLDAND